MIKFLFLCLIASSCASHLELNSRFCSGAGQWLNENAVVEDFSDQKAFDENFVIISGTGVKVLPLKELLAKRNIACTDLTSLILTIESDWVDTVVSFLPLVVLKQVRMRGTYHLNIDDEEGEKVVTEVMDQDEQESHGELGVVNEEQDQTKEEQGQIKEETAAEVFEDYDEELDEEEGYDDPEEDE